MRSASRIVSRVIDWNSLPYDHRIQINGPTTAHYSFSNLPRSDDPGWGNWKKTSDSSIVKAINIHGPFALVGHIDSERCEDGWLVVDDSGMLSAVPSEYIKPANGSELDETARPYGYEEVS